MANRRGGRGGSSGIGGTVTSIIILLLIGGAILAWININNIKSLDDAYMYLRGWSDKSIECEDEGGVEGLLGCEYIDKDNKDDSNKDDKDTDNNSDNTKKESKTDLVPKDVKIDEINKKLDNITLAEPADIDYVRSDWKHWIGSPCNTRQNVLIDQGKDVKVDEKKCKITSGRWIDPYSLDTFTNSSDLDIDHVIPLNYAAQMGGNSWSKEKKQEFANDRSQLLAVSAKENRGKSAKGPAEYMPPNKEYHCEYSKIWVTTADKYDLSITVKDRATLEKGLKTCK